MKKMNYLLALASLAAALGLNVGNVSAQDQAPPPQGQGQGGGGGGRGGGRGNFDPEQMRQRQMERYKEQLDVTDEGEWKVISGLIEKVSTARREVGGGFGGFGRGGGGPGGPGGGGPGGGGGRGGFGGQQLPEAEALQKAIEAKASNDEIKTKLAKYREARKVKEANLEKAQDELRKVLSVKQEAAAVLAGLLK